MKFVLVQDPLSENILPQMPMIGGYYNWPRVFDGEYRLFSEVEGNLNRYDVIFTALNRADLSRAIISKIREELGPNSSTKVVVSVDYSVELWKLHYPLEWLGRELMQADILVAAEPTIRKWMQTVVYGKKPVHLLLHPSDVDRIKTFRQPKERHQKELVAMLHDYNNDWQPLYLATRDLGVKTALICCNQKYTEQLKEYFDYTGLGFPIYREWLTWLSNRWALVDSYHWMHTYGRGSADCACLGIPHIATRSTYLQSILWPDLTTEPGDVWEQRKLTKRILKDKGFYNACVDQAFETVNMLSYGERKTAFNNLLDTLGKSVQVGIHNNHHCDGM